MEDQDPAYSGPEEDLKGVIQMGTSGELLRWVTSPHSRNQHQEAQRNWDVQWQAKVAAEVTSASSPAWGNLQVPQLTLADDLEVYLSTFERVADACQWPREQWAVRLVPALSGAAREAYCCLNLRDRKDYGKVKAAILCWCDIGRETRRQRFRQLCLQEAEGPRQAWGFLHKLCHQWLKPEIRSKEQILELLILEQFLNILPEEVRTWVWECHPETCAQVVALAEEFTLRQQEVRFSAGANRIASQTADPPSEEDLGASEILKDTWGDTGEATSSEWEEDKQLGEPDASSEDELAIQTRAPRKFPAFLPSLTLKAMEEPKDIESQTRSSFWGEKPHHCRDCGESFRVKQELALHKGIHRRERPFPCAVCGKRFTRLYHLTTHLRIHSGEKPYHCSECGKRYADASNFYKHQRSHATEKLYCCTDCWETFGDLSSFYKHQKGHRGDRPYLCDMCGDCFSKQKDLSAHRRIHEDGRVPCLS